MKGVPEAAPSTKSTFDAFVFHDTCPSHSCSDKTCGKHSSRASRDQRGPNEPAEGARGACARRWGHRGPRTARTGPRLPHGPFGGAHLRPARLSPPSLHHSARCAHCSHRRLCDIVAAGRGAPRAAAQQTRHKRAPRVALAGARIGARARAQAARLCPAPCPARGEDRNSETQGRGRGGRGGGAADAPRGEPGGCRAAACDGSLVCAARGLPRAPHGAASALSPILAPRFSSTGPCARFRSSRKQQYSRVVPTLPLLTKKSVQPELFHRSPRKGDKEDIWSRLVSSEPNRFRRTVHFW